MRGRDTAAADRTGSVCDLILDVGVFEHVVELVLELLPCQTRLKMLLVSGIDFVVSFDRLKYAPLDCDSYMQVPITINNDAHSRLFHPFSWKNHAGSRTSANYDIITGRFYCRHGLFHISDGD